jgi:hypothetical protein
MGILNGSDEKINDELRKREEKVVFTCPTSCLLL